MFLYILQANDLPAIIRVCSSKDSSIWLPAFFASKGIILLAGLFLAFETRNVKIKSLNESRFIAMSVYGAVIVSIALTPIGFALENFPNLQYGIIGIMILLSTSLILGLIFVAKVCSQLPICFACNIKHTCVASYCLVWLALAIYLFCVTAFCEQTKGSCWNTFKTLPRSLHIRGRWVREGGWWVGIEGVGVGLYFWQNHLASCESEKQPHGPQPTLQHNGNNIELSHVNITLLMSPTSSSASEVAYTYRAKEQSLEKRRLRDVATVSTIK